MPLPSPTNQESHNEWMDRCMSNSEMNNEFPDRGQRYAVCNNLWNDTRRESVGNATQKEEAEPMKKVFEIEDYKEKDEEVIEILASDGTVDRDNDIIDPEGWDFSGWLKTGSLLYGHNPSQLPVGSAEGAKIKDGQLLLYSKLAKKGTSEWHDAIRSLISQKVLKGVSVGFKAKEYEPNDHGGRTFTKQELLEISLTPVPANANARVLVKEFSDEVQESLIQDKDSTKESNEENPSEISIDKLSEEELKQLEEQIRERMQQYESSKSNQEEAQDAEPELNEDEQKFLNVVSNLKTIFGK